MIVLVGEEINELLDKGHDPELPHPLETPANERD